MIKKLVLFDIDGTLLISKGATRVSNGLAIQDAFGVEVDTINHPFGGKTDWQILRELLEPVGISSSVIGQKMVFYEQAFAKRLSDVIADFDVQALPGAHDLVNDLVARADVMVGLVTGNTSLTAPIKLSAAQFKPQDFVVGAFGSESDDRNVLPGLALERAIALSQHEIAPADVIIIGDTTKDIDCARAIGAQIVTVFTGFEPRENIINARPDYMLEDLTHFLDYVVF
jgi:phosphoglycolate phosphatase-like HAD superfamily hydrolase